MSQSSKKNEFCRVFAEAAAVHKQLLAVFEKECIGPLKKAGQMLIDCLEAGGCIYTCGNGGSAADAQHVAAELVGRFRRNRKGLPAVALTTDTSILTSVGNDYGFEEIFSRQTEALVRKGDILWAFSTSGKSPNILKAAQTAKAQGALVLSFTGRKNSPLEVLSDVCLCLEGPTASVQEIHQLAYHILCDWVEAHFAERS
ncbi:MAG: SIS domain-containing protein [Anaerohalosphaeraceae bacterium]